jgi:hypothetical protein
MRGLEAQPPVTSILFLFGTNKDWRVQRFQPLVRDQAPADAIATAAAVHVLAVGHNTTARVFVTILCSAPCQWVGRRIANAA